MSLIDTNISEIACAETVVSEPIRGGYRLKPAPRHRASQVAMRALTAFVIFSLIAAGGMVWTLSDASFSGAEPATVKALLSSSLYIVAAALFLSSSVSNLPGHVDIDLRDRILRLTHGRPLKRARVIRFEEIVRLEVIEGAKMADLNLLVSRMDYGRIVVRLAGGKSAELIGGEIAELERVAHRLRGEACVT